MDRRTKCYGSYEQLEWRLVSPEGEVCCSSCFRVLRALRHPGSRRYAIVPAHKRAAKAQGPGVHSS